MARGELVGEAYVRIHADTTFMRRALKRAAKQDAEDYSRDFSKRIETIADQEVRRGREALARAIALQDFSKFQRQFGTVEKAVRHVRQEMDVLLRTNRVYAKDVSAIENSLKKWAISAQLQEDWDNAIAQNKEYNAQLEKTHAAALRVNETYEKQVRLGTQMAEAQDKLELDHLTSSFHNLRVAVNRDNRERERAVDLLTRHGKSVDEVARALVRQHSAAGRLLTRTEHLNTRFTHFGQNTGRFFGKGSRNNFLNFLGSAIGGITSMTLKLGTLIGPISRVGRSIGEMIDTFKVLRVSGTGLAGSLGGALATGLKSSVAGLASLAAAAAVLVTLLPIIASGFSLLAGALVAVGGALTLGVIGGLLALVPLAASAAAGIGVLTLAVQEMNREGSEAGAAWDRLGSKWQRAIRGLRPELTGIATAMERAFGPLVDGFLGPLLKGMAAATRDIIRNFGEVMNSPTMRGFLDIWETALPASFESLGKGLNNLLGGFFAFFTPILSQAADLSMGFERLTARFLKWAQSPQGQNQIHTWMTTAYTAAVTLWDILGNLTSIIGNLFTAGTEGGGQDFLTYLEDITDRFNKFLESPEGKTQVKDFFADTKQFMIDTKGLLEGLAKTFDELDTAESREALHTLMDAAVVTIEVLARLVGWLEKVSLGLQFINGPAATVGALFDIVRGAFDKTTTAGQFVHGAFVKVKSAMTDLQLAAAQLDLFFWTAMSNMIKAGIQFAESFLQSAIVAFGWVPGLGDKLRTAAAGVGAFKETTNRHLDRVKKELEIKVQTLQAQQNVNRLAALINSIRDRSVVITATTRYVNEGRLPNGGRGTAGGSTFARGTIARTPTSGIFGEAGPEALVPLNRPLSQVDPSVRWLSAIAQGKAYAGGGLAGMGGISVAPGAIVVHSIGNPEHVAMAVLDRFTAAAN